MTDHFKGLLVVIMTSKAFSDSFVFLLAPLAVTSIQFLSDTDLKAISVDFYGFSLEFN